MGRQVLKAIRAIGFTLALFVLPMLTSAVSAASIPNGEARLEQGGYVRVSAIGLPPFGASSAGSAREISRQNAMGLAQRRLLAAILDLPVGNTKQTVRERLEGKPALRERLRTMIARAKVSGQELADGSTEVTLEVPYSGPGGLTEFFAALSL